MIEAPKIVVVLAAYSPNIEYFRTQLKSIADQKYSVDAILIGCDDDLSLQMANKLANDLEMNYKIISNKNIGSNGNFESLLNLAIEQKGSDLIFFSDQDDFWHKDKTQMYIELMSLVSKPVDLIHSDMRGINATGATLAESVHSVENRELSPDSLTSSILRNDVSGCTMAITNRLARLSIPFPKELMELGVHFDAWISSLAQVAFDTTSVDYATIDYRQHGTNQIGMATSSLRYKSLGSKISAYRIRRELARIVLFRVNERIKFLDKDMSLHSTSRFFHFPRRSLLKEIMRRDLKNRGLVVDILIGATLSPLHHFISRATKKIKGAIQNLTNFIGTLKVLLELLRPRNSKYLLAKLKAIPDRNLVTIDTPVPGVAIQFELTTSINREIFLFVPHLPPTPIFGGIQTAIRFASLMAANLGAELRLVSTNQLISNRNSCRKILGNSFIQPGVKYRIHDFAEPLEIPSGAILISTAWWTAEFCTSIQTKSSTVRHIYLIQDFEPGFYPWSENYHRAYESYTNVDIGVFNSKTLKEFFLKQFGDKMKPFLSFYPELLEKKRLVLSKKPVYSETNLVFYFRPSVSRNLTHFTLEAIRFFLLHRDQTRKVNLWSIGEANNNLKILDCDVESLGFQEYSKYQESLNKMNLGISLMYSPHPSYPPLDMVMSGVPVVTNKFPGITLPNLNGLIESPATIHDLGRSLITLENQLVLGKILDTSDHDFQKFREDLGDGSLLEVAKRLCAEL